QVADDVVPSDLDVQSIQEPVITDPIGHQMSKPRNSFRSIIIRSRHTDRACQLVIPMHAFRWLRNTKIVGNTERWVLAKHVERGTMRLHIQAAPTLGEAHETCDRTRSLEHHR